MRRSATAPKAMIQPYGFTVLEILIATAILTVMMLVLFNIFNQASRTWIAGESTINRSSATRMTLDMMAKEISQAVITTNNPSVAPTTPSLRFAGTNDSVYFIVPVAPVWDYVSDLAQVGYQLRSPPVTPGVSNLVRQFTEPTTANDGTGVWNPRHTGITPTGTPAGMTNNFATVNVLADYVNYLNFAYYDTNGTYYASWDSARGVGQTNMLPAVVEVTVVLLDDRIGSRFNAQTASLRATQLLQSGRTNTTVIRLINAP